MAEHSKRTTHVWFLVWRNGPTAAVTKVSQAGHFRLAILRATPPLLRPRSPQRPESPFNHHAPQLHAKCRHPEARRAPLRGAPHGRPLLQAENLPQNLHRLRRRRRHAEGRHRLRPRGGRLHRPGARGIRRHHPRRRRRKTLRKRLPLLPVRPRRPAAGGPPANEAADRAQGFVAGPGAGFLDDLAQARHGLPTGIEEGVAQGQLGIGLPEEGVSAFRPALGGGGGALSRPRKGRSQQHKRGMLVLLSHN
mmetsp:Transcript_7989/g.19941  ORF Transcript_7989/g.19941 Transcript_7989/m.19941 type:complete len:250 (+) Transcript_7989:658-1407(+)